MRRGSPCIFVGVWLTCELFFYRLLRHVQSATVQASHSVIILGQGIEGFYFKIDLTI